MTNLDLQGLERDEIASALRPLFPYLLPDDTALGATRGGRVAALAALAQIDPQTYERSRNFLSGDVTRLSAYLRHGVLTLAEVRDAALDKVSDPAKAGKLINEFAWRDYWQRLYFQLGEGIWQDREGYKTGFPARSYAAELPQEIREGTTTLACMDGFARDLTETGYLHNHARMWMAAYVVHWRRVVWQAGARWFLEHLLDGDPASNNLSWQWVASTFASKAYIFNRENLERYTAGAYCRKCPHAQARTCPFDRDYEELSQTLFPRLNDQGDQMPSPPLPFAASPVRKAAVAASRKPLVWIHTDGLNPDSPMLRDAAPALFVWDSKWLTESRISLKRIVFLAECLRELRLAVDLRVGDVGDEVLAAAKACGTGYVLAQRTPDPRLLAAAARVEQEIPVVWYDPPAFAHGSREFDLKRFSRYWQRAQGAAMERTRGV